MNMLLEVGSVENVTACSIKRWGRKTQTYGNRITLFQAEDPRATWLRKFSKQMADKTGTTKWFEMSQKIEALMRTQRNESNVNFYSASTYYLMGIPTDQYTPIFAVSRISGWTGHILEQIFKQQIDSSACRIHRCERFEIHQFRKDKINRKVKVKRQKDSFQFAFFTYIDSPRN